MRFGLPIPDRIQNAPDLWPGLALYYNGFIDLSSERSIGMAVGPIPFTRLAGYCEVKGIEGEQREDFIWIVARLDAKYLKWSAGRGNSRTVQPPNGDPGAKSPPPGRRPRAKGRARG